MGYYSDVTLCLTKTGAEKLAAGLETQDFASSAIKDLTGGEPVNRAVDSGAGSLLQERSEVVC